MSESVTVLAKLQLVDHLKDIILLLFLELFGGAGWPGVVGVFLQDLGLRLVVAIQEATRRSFVHADSVRAGDPLSARTGYVGLQHT